MGFGALYHIAFFWWWLLSLLLCSGLVNSIASARWMSHSGCCSSAVVRFFSRQVAMYAGKKTKFVVYCFTPWSLYFDSGTSSILFGKADLNLWKSQVSSVKSVFLPVNGSLLCGRFLLFDEWRSPQCLPLIQYCEILKQGSRRRVWCTWKPYYSLQSISCPHFRMVNNPCNHSILQRSSQTFAFQAILSCWRTKFTPHFCEFDFCTQKHAEKKGFGRFFRLPSVPGAESGKRLWPAAGPDAFPRGGLTSQCFSKYKESVGKTLQVAVSIFDYTYHYSSIYSSTKVFDPSLGWQHHGKGVQFTWDQCSSGGNGLSGIGMKSTTANPVFLIRNYHKQKDEKRKGQGWNEQQIVTLFVRFYFSISLEVAC